MKKIILLLVIFSVLLSGCGEPANQDVIFEPAPYCYSVREIGANGCPPDIPICVNDETCVAG